MKGHPWASAIVFSLLSGAVLNATYYKDVDFANYQITSTDYAISGASLAATIWVYYHFKR